MRNTPNLKAERYRILGQSGTNCGSFKVGVLQVVVGAGYGWDHVSVSHPQRVPAWEEMCQIKELFFRDDEVVMQLHPAKKNWINLHEKVLHLWRPQTAQEVVDQQAKWAAAGEPWEECVVAGPIPLPPLQLV